MYGRNKFIPGNSAFILKVLNKEFKFETPVVDFGNHKPRMSLSHQMLLPGEVLHWIWLHLLKECRQLEAHFEKTT